MKTIIKQGNEKKEYKCTCNFCDCEYKYTPNEIIFSDTGAIYVQCPTCALPNPPGQPERQLAAPVAVSPEMMQAILGNGKTMGPGGLMI